MLESLVSGLLNRLLGSYIEGFDSTQLNLEIWSGNVKLKNLKLRKDCLDGLELPINVKFGFLGELVLLVHWSSLKTKPVRIIIEDIYMLCTPRDILSFDLQEQMERELRLKLQKLANFELLNKSRPNNGVTAKNESFIQSLITKIIDNLQITIKNIHIRYEDINCIFSENPCTIGMSLSELSAVSTDEYWEPSFISITQNITHKLLKLNAFCIYWNTDSNTNFSDDENALLLDFKQSIADNIRIPDHQYLLHPVTGVTKLTISKLGSTHEQPHIDANMCFDELGVELNDLQYQELLHTLSKYHWYIKTLKYQKFRPNYSPAQNPRGWFQYVGNSVLHEIHEHNYRSSWEFIKDRGVKRRTYVRLWKQKLSLPDIDKLLPSEDDEAILKQLHEVLSYEDIKFFRILARREYTKEKLEAKSSTPENDSLIISDTTSSGSWISSWWNRSTFRLDTEEEKNRLTITEEQRKELYDVIEFDENEELVDSISLPKDRIKLRITSLLNKGSFIIKYKSGKHQLCEMVFEQCAVEFLQRPDSFMIKFELSEIKIEDGSPNTLYKHIVCVRDCKCNRDTSHSKDKPGKPFFTAIFENNPLDESADSFLTINLAPMIVYYHVHFINEFILFFSPPKKHLDTINAIIYAAEAKVEGWTMQTRVGLEALLDEHKTINLKLDAFSPTFIIPVDPHFWDSPCAIIDAGEMRVRSELVPKERIKEIKQLSVDEYNKIDSNSLRRLMFDRFNILLRETQFLIGPDVRTAIASLNVKPKDNHISILDRMELQFILDILIFPKALNLPRIRMTGKLPNLKISLNDYQYKIILELIEKLTPGTEDSETESCVENLEFIYLTNTSKFKNTEQSKEIGRLRKLKSKIDTMTIHELQQNIFEFDLTVDNAQLSLLECYEKSSMKSNKVVDVVGRNFFLRMFKKQVLLEVELSLSSLSVEDYIENSNLEEFRWLVTSNNFCGETKRDLFQLKYISEQRIVSYKNIMIEVFDQEVDLSLALLKFVLTPKSILYFINYAIMTFTDPNAVNIPADALRHNNENMAESPGKTKVNVEVEGVFIVLNDDSMKLATLEFSAGKLNLYLLPEKTKLSLKLGGVQLTDEINEGIPRDSVFRKLISIDDGEVAELLYETSNAAMNLQGYNSMFVYKTGAMRINFVDQSIHQIVNYLAKFQKMKLFFDKARESAYNQANNIDSVNHVKLEVLIKAPVIRFPNLIDPKKGKYDEITFHLGELYVTNEFDSVEIGVVNKIVTGIRNVKLSSLIYIDKDKIQRFEIIDDLNLQFDILYNQFLDSHYPVFVISGKFAPLSVNLTELQLRYMYLWLERLTKCFNVDEKTELEDFQYLTLNISPTNTKDSSIGKKKNTDFEGVNETVDSFGTYVKFSFNVPYISLTLHNNTNKVVFLDNCGITTIKLHNFGLEMQIMNNNEIKAETHIEAFTIEDIRRIKDNKHTELIPKNVDDNYQFMALFSRKQNKDIDLINFSITVNSPKVILVIDYLFSLKSFFNSAFPIDERIKVTTVQDKYSVSNGQRESSIKLAYSVNIIDSSIILLASPEDVDSEAIVFFVGQILLSNENIMSLNANNVGMFLCKMKTFYKNRIRLLEDFSISALIDRRGSTPKTMVNSIQISVGSLIMKLSLREIRLVMFIVNKALSLADQDKTSSSANQDNNEIMTRYGRFSKDFKRKISLYVPSIISSITSESGTDTTEYQHTKITLQAEKLNVDVAGFRLVLIGDIHELPITDFNIKPFSIEAKNWSSNIDALTTIETYTNVFNYSRSSWEPLLESFQVTFHLFQNSEKDQSIMFDIISKSIAEITLSSRTIALLSQIPISLQGDANLEPRGADKPYKVFNDTGIDLEIWIKSRTPGERKQLQSLNHNAVIPWEFEDWRTARENLDLQNSNILVVCSKDRKYTNNIEVDATKEGEFLIKLYPPFNGVHDRLAMELKLCEDNIKLITLRSSLLLENTTHTPIEVKTVLDEFESWRLLPGETRSVPISAAYHSKICMRPICDIDFPWSDFLVYWKDLLSCPLSLTCKTTDDRFFIFSIDSKYDSTEPLSRIYPHMRIVISSPLILENLLPYDLHFVLFDQEKRPKSGKLLKKGQTIPIHDVKLESVLLLAINPSIDDFDWSQEVIVNSPDKCQMKPENYITLKHHDGITINLKLNYHSIEGTRAKIISIYAPYIILNGTDRDLYVEYEGQTGIFQSKIMIDNYKRISKPKIFSFTNEKSYKNRARLRFKDTMLSIPTSFDAIGQAVDISMEIPNQDQECNVGVNVTEGVGKYRFTKIVEIRPRYVIKNNLDDDLEVSSFRSRGSITLFQKNCTPLYKLRNSLNKYIILRLACLHTEWSQPFSIKNIGTNYLKILDKDDAHRLLKIDIALENATIFIEINDPNDRWPYSIRNFSDYEFIFWQRDPKLTSNDNGIQNHEDYEEIDYKPIYYRLPSRSVMPYAWDYPGAIQRKLVLLSRKRRREIDLNDIGNLKPMRLPGSQETDHPAIVELNIMIDNGVQVLVITNYREELSLHKLRSRQSSNKSFLSRVNEEKFEIINNNEVSHYNVFISFEGIGISLINCKLQEVLYISLKGLELQLDDSDTYSVISWKLKWMQIDNQLFGGVFQNILYPTKIPNSTKEIDIHPALSGSVSRVKDDTYSAWNFKLATILLQEITLQLDEDFLIVFIDFIKFSGAAWSHETMDSLCSDFCEIPKLSLTHQSQPMFFEMFLLQPTLLHLSFVRTERVNLEDMKVSGGNTLKSFVNALTMALGNINNAPIKLNSLMIENIRAPLPMIIQIVRTHYGQQFFYQLHKILGSADFLGNPVGLFNNISSGVMDIFYEPYQGYVLNDRPQELGIGFAKGGLSFMKKSVFGLSDSFAKFTGSIAKGLSAATQDSEFQERRRLQQRQKNTMGLGIGATSFVSSISSGITGIALDPYKGASKEGPSGFVKGLGRGLIGLPTKTAIGVLDLASNMSEGIRNTTTLMDDSQVSSVRLPRFISHEQIIKPYNSRESQGQYWLKTSNGGQYMNDQYVGHVVLNCEGSIVIVSMTRILRVRLSTNSIIETAQFMDISGIRLSKTGLHVLLKGMNREMFFVLSDNKERRYLYNVIGIAVNDFNSKYDSEI